MFKIPDWGDDVPKTNVIFEKKSKKNGKKEDKPPKNLVSIIKNKVKVTGKNKKTNDKKPNNLVMKTPPQTKQLNPVEQNKIGKSLKKPEKKRQKKPLTNVQKPGNKENNSVSLISKNNIQQNIKQNKTNGNIKKKNLSQKRRLKKQSSNGDISEDDKNQSPKSPKKHKGDVNSSPVSPKKTKINKTKSSPSSDLDYTTDKPDEVLLNMSVNKFNESFKNDDKEAELFKESPDKKRKEKIKQVLALSKRSIVKPKSTLRDKMLERLKAAQFRFLNEKLYTSSGSDAQQLFQSDPAAFQTYHQGYQQQLKKWPVNPLDIIVKKIKKMPKTTAVADMGCGEAVLAQRVQQSVRSFDLVATAPGVEACDMAHTPLLAASMDVAVYCLALMGTGLTQYLVEANRILKIGGLLLIAEVESRFDDVDAFARDVQRLGFKLLKLDKSNTVFYFLEFRKVQDVGKKGKKPLLSLKPCLYKKR